MVSQRDLVLQATSKALETRKTLGRNLYESICIYDVANELGVKVQFMEASSMEGLYSKIPRPIILLSSLRPAGRRVYTCAHELGHHVFGHGFHIDELVEQVDQTKRFDPDEFLVDCFAGFLLMPKSAVANAFNIRGWDINKINEFQVFNVASWFGVGYSTLLTHMSRTLNLVSKSTAERLQKIQPKEIRCSVLGSDTNSELIMVDQYWNNRPIDLEVGDQVLLPPNTVFEGENLEPVKNLENKLLFFGRKPGLGRVYIPNTEWSSFVRVARTSYVGMSEYRHFEDPDYV